MINNIIKNQKMKTIGLIALMILMSSILLGQDFDNLMLKRHIDCSDIAYNSGIYFTKYMEENKIDSAKYLLKYWETKCGVREPIFRAKILLALKQNEFNDSLFSEGTLNYIINYQNRMDMIKYSNYYSYDNYKSYYGFIPPGQEFDTYTQNLAKTLTTKYNSETVEYLMAEFYGENSDTLFSKIQTNTYGQSKLIDDYKKTVERYVNMTEFHIAWFAGIWIPTAELKKIGTHPELGFQIGAKHKKMNYDFTMAIKFLNSPNYYYARRTKSTDSLELTNHFFGGHIGFDIGRDIYSKNGHELQITGGIAFDGFDALKEDKSNDYKSESASSYNLSIGLAYRYYTTNSFYLGLRAKYNFVDYSLNKVVDMTGNLITIQLTAGSLNNVFRNNSLEALKYKLRK